MLGGTGSILGGTSQNLVGLGHYWLALVSTWWYWAIIGRYLSVLSGTRSILGGTGCYFVALGHIGWY